MMGVLLPISKSWAIGKRQSQGKLHAHNDKFTQFYEQSGFDVTLDSDGWEAFLYHIRSLADKTVILKVLTSNSPKSALTSLLNKATDSPNLKSTDIGMPSKSRNDTERDSGLKIVNQNNVTTSEIDAQNNSVIPAIGLHERSGKDDGPLNTAKLRSPTGLASRGSRIYIGEHPDEIQGAIKVCFSSEGLIKYRSVWNEISTTMGLVSKQLSVAEPEHAKHVNPIKPRLFEICQKRGGGQNPSIPCNSAI